MSEREKIIRLWFCLLYTSLIELFKIDMETQKYNPQGNASLAGAEFTWKYYASFYNKDNLLSLIHIFETDLPPATFLISKGIRFLCHYL